MTEMTYSTLKFWKKNFTHQFRIEGGMFWKWKIWIFLTPYWVFNQTFFQNSSIFSELVKCGWVGIREMWVSMGLHIGNWVFWIFFSPIVSGWWGDVFGSENFGKFWPHIGFSTKVFFQNSSLCSNKSHRWDVGRKSHAVHQSLLDTPYMVMYTPCGQWTDPYVTIYVTYY